MFYNIRISINTPTILPVIAPIARDGTKRPQGTLIPNVITSIAR